MYKIDFKNGFLDCNDYVFPKKIKMVFDAIEIIQLYGFNERL